jgi:hypothetical protein
MKIKWAIDKSEFKYSLDYPSYEEQAITDTKMSSFVNHLKVEKTIVKFKRRIRIQYVGIISLFLNLAKPINDRIEVSLENVRSVLISCGAMHETQKALCDKIFYKLIEFDDVNRLLNYNLMN